MRGGVKEGDNLATNQLAFFPIILSHLALSRNEPSRMKKKQGKHEKKKMKKVEMLQGEEAARWVWPYCIIALLCLFLPHAGESWENKGARGRIPHPLTSTCLLEKTLFCLSCHILLSNKSFTHKI